MERAALNEIARRMAGAQRVAVLCHTHPDGDALGSAYAPVSYTHLDVYKRQWNV